MLLGAGTRLGPYEILDPIGAGGMGEVYRARDTRLDRIVAIKISAEQFSERFDREARAVAALNHPNICTLHDVGPNYLVMEYIEGSTLAERIGAGAIPLPEALPIARQIAEALEAAHAKGIVHRDLKPGNIKLTPEGKVKVLDFGLAKAFETGNGGSDPTNSPTLTLDSTRAGVILGTAGYMSPEQARGTAADKRADVWSFGVVLFEMLTGREIFTGETVSDTLAAVLRAELDWSQLPADTPPSIRRLLRRALERDRKKRLRDIGDALLEIDEPAADSVALPQARVRWLLPALAMAILAVAALAFIHFREAPPAPAPAVRFQIPMPPRTEFANHMSISPDGRFLAFAATGADGRQMLWLRPLDGLEARMVPGTDGAGYFFWSPDSRFVGFWANGKLKKVEAGAPAPVQTICETPLALGASWHPDGFIFFGSNLSGLSRVPSAGGTPVHVTEPEIARGERYHSWPVFLPDLRHYLFLASQPEGNALFVGALDSKERKRLTEARTGAPYIQGSDPDRGHLLFLRDTILMAQAFDARRLQLTGEPFAVAEQVGSYLSRAFFGASQTGVLVYRTGAGLSSQLEWFDRQGKPWGKIGTPTLYNDVVLSPDGKRVAVSQGSSLSGTDLWVLDGIRGTRFTYRGGRESNPVWSPDGNFIAFASGSPSSIYRKSAAGGANEDELWKSTSMNHPCDWSRDGKFLLYNTLGGKTGIDLWVLRLDSGKATPFLATEFNELYGQFSPDGRWIAYVSDESGAYEIYVQPFSETGSAGGAKYRISTGGGTQPRWRGDGRELFYLAPDRTLMAVDVKNSPPFQAGVPHALFPTRILTVQTINGGTFHYAASADGKRFLVITAQEEAADIPFTMVVNWRPGR